MNRELIEKAKKVIKEVLYATVATVTAEGQPWNSPVYTSYDEHYNFYWVSWKENDHSQNVRANGRAYLVIFDSTVPAGSGFGVISTAKQRNWKRLRRLL